MTENQALSAKQQSIIPIATFTANGDMEKLKTALNEGLDAGLTVNEIKEILVQMYAYAGFPRSLNGIHAFMSVMDERQAKGIEDEIGSEASPLPADMNKDEYGANVRAKLAGQDVIPPPGGFQLFTPVIDTFLKEHLFADIFARDNLDYQSRELATISALASMTGTTGQLRFHLAAAMNTGLTEAQMRDFISVINSKVGNNEAVMADEVLAEVLSNRKNRGWTEKQMIHVGRNRMNHSIESAEYKSVNSMSADAPSAIVVRPATSDDVSQIGRLGALLVEKHHDLDSRRFLAASNRTPADYASFLGTKLENPDVVILVAERNGIAIRYAYAAVEGYDYMSLRGPAGVLHDIIIDPEYRGCGVGRLLLDAILARLKSRGVPRVVLSTAEGNEAAQRLFATMGFRRTMIEMTRELDERDDYGNPRLEYQGNWRDIFQNWEALAWSFPEYVESMVTVFLDATTADGYNPYRISREGIDWEVPDPEDPWSNIGYWSDHQIIYLLKLLETSERFHPGRLSALVSRPAFTHADVPYRIAPYTEILKDPYNTITFDTEREEAIAERVATEGSDGRLVHGANGDLVRVTLAEKVLLLLLAKLVNLVPDGGIWMNTQRPEWNDANNALVGRGLSVVTLAYVRRYLTFLQDLLNVDIELSTELADLMTAVRDVLADNADALAGGFDEVRRKTVMDGLGEAGTAYRQRVYAGLSGDRSTVAAHQVAELLSLAQRFVDAGLRANLRDDALFHSYNVLDLGPNHAGVRRLSEMLEGQVAILSSGLLSAKESLDLISSLRTSQLYRADQHSYILYPDKDLPRFLTKNRFDAEQAATCPLIDTLEAAGDSRIVVRDVDGAYHFAGHIHNARDVAAELDGLSADPALRDAVEQGRTRLLEIFENVFRHAEFTGRSGTFFAYEGLGSIYWHMVTKLLLAVQETLERAVADDEAPATIRALLDAYEDVRAGIGYCKDPATYGAFPTDPYSHTPKNQGARQPGMTGQVKEEVLTRLGELGLRVEDGRIAIRPVLLRASEWTTMPGTFTYLDLNGRPQSIALPERSLAFTFCQVPVVFHRGDRLEVIAHLEDGTNVNAPAGVLDTELSVNIFRRDGRVRSLDVQVSCIGVVDVTAASNTEA